MHRNLDQLEIIRVLLVDDDEDDYLITKKIFSQIEALPFTLEWADSYEKGVELIDANVHDIYLIDYRLGGQTGLELLEYAKPTERTQPFILLTGVGDSDVEWQSLKLAAADYLVKGQFDARELSRTLTYAFQRKRLEHQRIEQLLEVNRTKDEFISIASHQLRTPATGVKQYLGMVIEGFLGDVEPSQLALLEKAYESNERQLRIVTDLLKVAQVDSGKLKLHKVECDMNELARDVIAEQKDTLERREQTVVFNPAETPVMIEADADALRMVLENIIDNASKYSEPGKKITVGVEQTGGGATIAVCDEGVGIDDDDLSRLYEKFMRFNNKLSTRVGGSGLGLYWAKRIIDLHGGRIEYTPNIPHGSTFTIFIPSTVKV